jgi:hypothetical protein
MVKNVDTIAIATREKANVAKNWGSFKPSATTPVVEYAPYAPMLGMIV